MNKIGDTRLNFFHERSTRTRTDIQIHFLTSRLSSRDFRQRLPGRPRAVVFDFNGKDRKTGSGTYVHGRAATSRGYVSDATRPKIWK